VSAFDAAWDATGRSEGGYVFDPSDSGGETNHGITRAVARRHGYTGRMVDLPPATARAIAKTEFWDGIGGDRLAGLSERLALEIFDTGINCGPGTAVRFLQRSLNALNRLERDYADIAADGRIGPVTLYALREYLKLRGEQGVEVLLRALNALQGAYYITLVEAREKDERFLFGWLANRVTL
jgi:lysozyme family protein